MASTILVVEDEPAIAELVAVNLSFAGHKVLRAADTLAADLLRAVRPTIFDESLADSWNRVTTEATRSAPPPPG